MRETIGAAAFLSNSQDHADNDREERRKAAPDGFPARPPDLGRRASWRQRVLLNALIFDRTTGSVHRCGLDNVSEGGARIRLSERCLLPPKFWVIACTTGLAYWAEIVWRHDDRLGVSALEPIDLSDASSLVERRLKAVWWKARQSDAQARSTLAPQAASFERPANKSATPPAATGSL